MGRDPTRGRAVLDGEHTAYRWLCGGVSLNHHTLSDFRVERMGVMGGEVMVSRVNADVLQPVSH